MTKLLKLMFFLIVSIDASAQYPFEKYPELKLQPYYNWKTYDKKDKVDNTLTIPDFFSKGSDITIQLTSYTDHWSENSSIRIFQNQKQITQFYEDIGFPEIAMDTIKVGDVNNDGLKDIKIVQSYMGNGLDLWSRVIYLLQKPNLSFAKISFDDIMFYSDDRKQRDFDGDGNYEVITMDLKGYKNHNYWVYNLYEFKDYKLINVNTKDNYPIMIPFLYNETFEITKKISREKMKDFTEKLPKSYIIK